MAILVGIDEAGYGPLLGPLVVSGVAFSLPQSLLKSDLWTVLNNAVSRDKKRLAGRLLINDSKKAFSREKGPVHLLRTVLACLETLWQSQNPLAPFAAPQTLLELLKQISPASWGDLSRYPWYTELSSAALSWPQDAAFAAGVWQRTLEKQQMKLLWMQTRFLEAGLYNERIEKIKNKSRVLFIEICSLIHEVFCHYSDHDGPVQFLIDRQGGRMQYHQELLGMFPGMELTILSESETLSSYEMSSGNKKMRLHFCVEADSKFLPVSLASMTSKLIRELLVEELNRYFAQTCPVLKPTAGYWQDGQRFIADLKKYNLLKSLKTELLIRQK
jgi:ribonuclease HIII